MVGVECTTSDWHVTAQKLITIQERLGEFGAIKCYGQNISTDGSKCNAVYGRPIQIQVLLQAGMSLSFLYEDNCWTSN